MRSKIDYTKMSPVINQDDYSITAVIVCAGKGERTGLAYNKILYNIGRKTVLENVLDAFTRTHVQNVMLVIQPEDEMNIRNIIKPYVLRISLCYGGPSRPQSVYNGLHAIKPCDIVVIHDGARPYIKPAIIDASIISAIKYGSGIVAVPTTDSIKQVTDNNVVRSLSRAGLYNIQTPQTFRYKEILNAYESVSGVFTDDSEVYEAAGYTPHIVIGSYDNIKITTSHDLLHNQPRHTLIGIGYDVHKLAYGRELILGGVKIPYDRGLDGHSDADALTHAIMDALLSAAGLPDIGVLFPDNNDAYKGISSIKLLDRVVEMLRQKKLEIVNVSAVVMAQQPKLAPYIEDMRDILAAHLKLNVGRVNISATTTENVGVIGEGNAMAASASCLLIDQLEA